MDNLELYQTVILFLALWLVIALVGEVPVLTRSAENGADWQVVLFRGALLFLAAVVAARYVFDISPWAIAAGWFVLDVAATANTIYIRSRRER